MRVISIYFWSFFVAVVNLAFVIWRSHDGHFTIVLWLYITRPRHADVSLCRANTNEPTNSPHIEPWRNVAQKIRNHGFPLTVNNSYMLWRSGVRTVFFYFWQLAKNQFLLRSKNPNKKCIFCYITTYNGSILQWLLWLLFLWTWTRNKFLLR